MSQNSIGILTSILSQLNEVESQMDFVICGALLHVQ